MNQQFTDIISIELDPILDELTSITLTQSNIMSSPLKVIRQSNIVEIQNVHTKYKRVVNETIQKIILEIEKYYSLLIERNQAINFKLYTRIAEQSANLQQLQEVVNQLTFENQEFRNGIEQEEVCKEFYDPQQYVIKQQKKELLEQYDLNDQLSNKLKRQSSLSQQLEDKFQRQQSKIFCLEEQVKSIKKELDITKQQKEQLQTQVSCLQIQLSEQQYKLRLSGDLQSSLTRQDIIALTQIQQSSDEKPLLSSDQTKIPIERYSSIGQETTLNTNRYSRKKNQLNQESIQFKDNSDFEINIKLLKKQQQKEMQEIMRNQLFDIQDIIKPKYRKRPQQLNDLYLFSNKYRNSSVDYYYEPPKHYRFNMQKQLDSPQGLRCLLQNHHRMNTLS